MDFTKRNPRRTFLQLVGSGTVIGLTGCTSDGGTGDNGTGGAETANDGTENDDGSETETTAGNIQSETGTRFTSNEPRGTDTNETSTGETPAPTPALSGPVPAVYRTATSLAERNVILIHLLRKAPSSINPIRKMDSSVPVVCSIFRTKTAMDLVRVALCRDTSSRKDGASVTARIEAANLFNSQIFD
jgi:hypothetical protein